MEDCSNHKKEIAGITDMKVLAEMIGDLHYQQFKKFLKHLSDKVYSDAFKDSKAGRTHLALSLSDAATAIITSSKHIARAWQISKQFMNSKNK